MKNKTERIRRSLIGGFGLGPRYLAREAKLKMDRNAGDSSGVTLVAIKGQIYAPLNESNIAREIMRHWPKCLIGTYRRGVKIPAIAEDIESMMEDCSEADDGEGDAKGCCPSPEV